MNHSATKNDDDKGVARNFRHQHLDVNNMSQFLLFFQTNARFLSNHPKPTADSLSSIQQAEVLVTPNNTAVPMLRVEDAENEKEIAVPVEDHSDHKVKVTWLCDYNLKFFQRSQFQSIVKDITSFSPQLNF